MSVPRSRLGDSATSNKNTTSCLVQPVQHQVPIMSASSLQIAPLQSFTSLPPTPPATKEKTVTPISRILVEVGRHKAGHCLPAGEHWLRFPLNGEQYEDLHRQLRKDNLWDHYEHKIRYMEGVDILLLINAMADTITSHQPNYMLFESPVHCTKASDLISRKSSYDSWTKLPIVVLSGRYLQET